MELVRGWVGWLVGLMVDGWCGWVDGWVDGWVGWVGLMVGDWVGDWVGLVKRIRQIQCRFFPALKSETNVWRASTGDIRIHLSRPLHHTFLKSRPETTTIEVFSLPPVQTPLGCFSFS